MEKLLFHYVGHFLAGHEHRFEKRYGFFLTDYAVVDEVINHLRLTFVAERPPPPALAYQEHLMAAEAPVDCYSQFIGNMMM